jgi:hypothetical protein
MRHALVVQARGEQFVLVGVGVTYDADDAVDVAAVRALQGAAVDVEQVHGVGTDGENIVGCGSEHGGDQRTSAHCFRLDYFLLAAAPHVQAARVVHEDDLLGGFVDANLAGA